MTDILKQVQEILEYGPICDHCLGRMYGKSSHGLGNEERGKALRIALALLNNTPYIKEEETCWICGNLFDKTDLWAEKIKDALKDIEHETILVGCKVPPLVTESEEMVWTDLSLQSPEPIKAEFNRVTGKAVTALTGSEVNFKRPDIVIVCDIGSEEVDVQINPLYIYGRYCKYERGIPQTRWHCRECRGKGCERCNFTGKMYQDSVEELIGNPILEVCDAKDAVLHGAGREDIDARMLGTGRPFALEIVEPKIRSVSLKELEALVNKSAENRVSITLDHVSDRHEVETLKSGKAHKKYSILVEVEGDISINDVKSALADLKGTTINQRTPERVSHRRADKVRKRQCIDIECEGVEDGKFRIYVLGDAGLYIKELISGDEGRTKPSLTEKLGCSAHVTSLDVIMVEGVVPENQNEVER
ncbi:tRNA pseudouridine(54/55) synthase Pus10 [Methanoplanus sp. FWC-SCC4]|uniref:tRNA pseudouridine synthase Pus10 n=1 Tax=Methanochimaera problematica TaxID=2609417 RepID=A0AA97FA99_9EURY|nr:tRNA pseudouridine(54/55) synthase Pus10 [Methanoplanus sp. FWC-SCC4]WOF15755.1 tRNA pseudouridine(54/55) synthase Pus10 [Methanoplanus sp. FWC-SCC4]